jgi:aspartyl-tRNA(Asn)/glutamyl-tRNA(Gln) amidotransferase subunit C
MKEQTLSKEEVKHVAKLANLELSETEVEKFTKQLREVIDYNVGLLDEVKTEGVEPLYQVNGEVNTTRVDETKPSLKAEQVLKNAASEHNGFFKVKAVIEE